MNKKELVVQKALGLTERFYITIFYLTEIRHNPCVITTGHIHHMNEKDALRTWWANKNIRKYVKQLQNSPNRKVVACVQNTSQKNSFKYFLHRKGTRKLDLYHSSSRTSPWMKAIETEKFTLNI